MVAPQPSSGPIASAAPAGTVSLAAQLDAVVAEGGTGAHDYVRSGKLSNGADAMRNLADAVHFLGVLHGRFPGIVELAADTHVDPGPRAWLAEAADAFATERALLSRITAACGPVPSTHGQDQCEATVAGQRRALDMLARSERRGCALGAAIALALEWRTLRVIIDISAGRIDMDVPGCTLPALPATARLADDFGGTSPAAERAMLFGAHQLVQQHKGLWDLLAAREIARRIA